MTWFSFALLGYLLYALVTISNKFLLRQRATTKPLVFTFWICLMSLLSFVLAPFGLHWPGWGWLAFDILTGLVYFVALLAYYQALDINEASRASSLVGGVTPVLVLTLSYLFLGEALGWLQLVAFSLLVIGGFLISLEKGQSGFHEAMKGLKYIIATIILSAVYFVMLKHLFNYQDFITGFVWSRMGLVAGSLIVLFYPAWRYEIRRSFSEASAGLSSLIAGAKIMAGFGSLFVSLAVARGSASLVNALQGAQFAFLFLLTLWLSKFWPAVCNEKLSGAIIAQKFAAIGLICIGLALIAL